MQPASRIHRLRRVTRIATIASFVVSVIGLFATGVWGDSTEPYDEPPIAIIAWSTFLIAGAISVLLFVAFLVLAKIDAGRSEQALRSEFSELRASRGRLVDASDAARRQIERDLHDGVQPRLVGLLLNVRVAQRAGELDGAESLLNEVEQELAAILHELRSLASGILPPALTDLGLEAALLELTARMPFGVDVVVPRERLPDRVEVTAYFVIAEALANAAKHAQATHVSVRMDRRGDRAVVDVHDDGIAGADPNAGSGLRGLADRVEAIEGRLSVRSQHGAGTTVRAELPCAS